MAGLRERQKADRTRRILDVARGRFHQEGYEAVTIESIAAEAGLSAVTVYNYFGAKAGILLALVGESDARLNERLRKLVAAPTTDLREAVAEFGRIQRRHALSDLPKPTWRQVLAGSIVEGGGEFGRTYAALDRALVELMGELVARFQAEGALPADLDAAAFGDTLYAVLNLRFIQHVADDGFSEPEVDALIRRDLDMIFRAGGGDDG